MLKMINQVLRATGFIQLNEEGTAPTLGDTP